MEKSHYQVPAEVITISIWKTSSTGFWTNTSQSRFGPHSIAKMLQKMLPEHINHNTSKTERDTIWRNPGRNLGARIRVALWQDCLRRDLKLSRTRQMNTNGGGSAINHRAGPPAAAKGKPYEFTRRAACRRQWLNKPSVHYTLPCKLQPPSCFWSSL